MEDSSRSGSPSDAPVTVYFSPLALFVLIPILIALISVAVLVTGYSGTSFQVGTWQFTYNLGGWQPVPVYVVLAILLLTFQAYISLDRSVDHTVYLFLTSLFALLYAANVVFSGGQIGLFTNPWFYVAVNVF